MREPLRLAVIYDQVDAAMAAARRQAEADGVHIPCRSGCSACCFQMVLISQVEARAIVDRLVERHGCASLDVLRERAEQQAHRVRAVNSFRAYLRLREPCLFLDPVHHTCTVYEVRPLACRLHLIASDPAKCSLPFATVTAIDVGPVRHWAALQLGKHCAYQLSLPLHDERERLEQLSSMSDDAYARTVPSFATLIIEAIDGVRPPEEASRG